MPRDPSSPASPASPARATRRRRLTDHPGWSALVGAVTGVVGAVALGAAGLLPSAGPARPLAPPDPVQAEAAFLAAWRAHLDASWSVDEVDERTTTSGASVRFEIHRAQTPPDSVEIGGGTVSARRGAVALACGPGPHGTGLACRSAPAPRTWGQDVDQEVAALRAALSGPRALYAIVAAGAGCWSLTLKVPAATVPVVLGRAATYCLDTTTWALRSSVITRVGAVDRVTTTAGHAPATAADLALPPGAAIS